MPEDRSLDEFAVDESSDAEPEDVDVDPEDTHVEPEDVDVDPEDTDADPATPTATWTTDGAACDRCGESISRRWFDEGALVCAACKEW